MKKEKKETLEQARYIFSTGKLIQDRILRIHTGQLAAGSRDGGYEELSVSQLHLVRMIRDRGEATITQLAVLLDVSPPSASVMVDRLVDKGMLKREQSRVDRRKVLVRISPKAVKRIEKVENAILQSFEDLVERIGPQAARKWCEALARIKVVLEGDLRTESSRTLNKR